MESHQKVLIIGFVWPEPKSSAAGNRMLQLISLFKAQQWEVTFASAASDSEHMDDLAGFGIERVAIRLNSPDFDAFITKLNPSIVLFDRFMTEEQFGWRVAKHLPNALRVLDTEDLHFLRHARQKAVKANRDVILPDLLSEETAKREIASILRCDVSLIISEFEMQLLKEVFHIDVALLHYLPLFASLIPIGSLPSFEDRKHFVCIGNFLHEPNKDAVKYLKDVIWPTIHWKFPEAEMHIYGAYPPQQVLQWDNPKQHFFVHGRAGNALDIVKNARIVLAPIRFGAGIKGKLLEAMACGTPSVTTAIGAEAMHDGLPWNGFIGDDPQEMAQAAVDLYQDKTAWHQAQENGFALINKKFLKTLFEEDFPKRILSLQSNLELHRTNNFTGAMLLHHTMKSTEYMSRWIEAKNK